jgi:hypothetical protein
MPSLIPGFEYDIFISYRQKDNKHDGWVTEFVNNLKGELESTFKEEVSVYFDINPHDGLLETHDVEASLKEKMKCAVFIPIISRTYCDPRSFAWEHEFKAFVDQASHDQFGLKVKLAGGNVASRVLPVRIYDLNKEDINLFESVSGGVLRGIEFIYKSAGVNRPLRANEDHAQYNLNKTYYRDQINKMSHSIQEIIQGLRTGQGLVQKEKTTLQQEPVVIKEEESRSVSRRPIQLPRKKILAGIAVIAVFIALILVYPKTFKKDEYAGLSSEQVLEKAIRFCDPFNYWGDYSGKIHLIHVIFDGDINADEIFEIQTREGYYKCSSVYSGGTTEVKGIINGEYFREINGKSVHGKELNTGNIDWYKGLHYCHFGLLMELKAAGMVLGNKVKLTKLRGEERLAIDFTCDTTVLKNNFFKGQSWTIYLDPTDYSMKGFEVDGLIGVKGYAVITGNLLINSLNIPMMKTYYSSTDDSFLAIDLFTNVK